MLTDEEPLRELLFYWGLDFSHTLHVLKDNSPPSTQTSIPKTNFQFRRLTFPVLTSEQGGYGRPETGVGGGEGRGGARTCWRLSASAAALQTPAGAVSICQHMPASASIVSILQHLSASVSICQHLSASVGGQHLPLRCKRLQKRSASVSICQYLSALSASACICQHCQHLSALAVSVSIRQHLSASISIERKEHLLDGSLEGVQVPNGARTLLPASGFRVEC